MAGLGKKTFTAGEVLTAADVNGYLMEQSVMVFGGTAARSSAIPTPSEGMVTYLSDLNDIQAYDGSNWISTGLTAGTTTANYGWPIPASGSIASLGTAIDTTVAGLGGGLTHITTATITTQSTYDITSIFSSTYDNYRFVFNATGASSSTEIRAQLLSNTTPSSANYYVAMRGLNSSGGSADTNQANASYISFAGISSVDPTQTSIYVDISQPFLTKNTNFNFVSCISDGSSWYGRAGAGLHINPSSYNGFRLYTTGATFSGLVRVYGYQNS